MAHQTQATEMSPVAGTKFPMLWEIREESPVPQGLTSFPKS